MNNSDGGTVGRWELAAMGAIVALVVAYQVATLQRQCLFTDEIAELNHAELPLDRVVVLSDSMPPLYTLMLKPWVAAFGANEAARWISAAFGLGAVVALWAFIRRITDPATAVAAAAALAVASHHLYYSQLIRAYAAVTCLSVVVAGCFALAMKTGRVGWWRAFMLTGLVGAYLHYYFLILLLLLFLIGVAGTSAPDRWALVKRAGWMAALGLPLLYLLPMDFQFQQGLRENRPLDLPALGYTYASYFSGYCLGPSRGELHQLGSKQAALGLAPWAAGIVVCSGVLAWWGQARLRRYSLLWPTLLLFVGPIAIVGAAGALAGITYNTRFVAWCVAPLAVLLGAGAVEGRRSVISGGAVVGLLAIVAVALVNRNFSPRYGNEAIDVVVAAVASKADANELVFVVSDYQADIVRHYWGEGNRVIALPVPGESSHAVVTAEDAQNAVGLLDELSGGKRCWLIYSREFHGDPEGFFLAELSRARPVEEAAGGAGVRLFRVAADRVGPRQ